MFLSQVWDQFIELGENKSDLVDISSVLLMAEYLEYQKQALHADLKIPSEVHLADVKCHSCHLIMIWTLRRCNICKMHQQ